MNPRFFSCTVSYDVAGNIWQALLPQPQADASASGDASGGAEGRGRGPAPPFPPSRRQLSSVRLGFLRTARLAMAGRGVLVVYAMRRSSAFS